MKAAARPSAMPASVSKTETVISVDPLRVRPFPDQPRAYFDKEKLASLEASIKSRGQLQPGMVQEISGDKEHEYELVDGQRRWTACMRLKIPFRCVVVDAVDVEDQFEISVASNFQRVEHTPMEEARAIERLCTTGGRTEAYVAELFGRDPFWVNAQRRLVHLVPEIQKMIDPEQTPHEQLMSTKIAQNLARLDPERQLAMLAEIRGLPVGRALDRIHNALRAVGVVKPREINPSHHDRAVRTYLRNTVHKAEGLLERLPAEEAAKLVDRLRGMRQLFQIQGEINLAIDRLQELNRRLGGVEYQRTQVASSSTPVDVAPARELEDTPPSGFQVFDRKKKPAVTPPPAKPAGRQPGRQADKAPVDPKIVYSHPMTCPKCRATNTRFRRSAEADPKVDSWMCIASGCLIRIAHVNIRVDTRYVSAVSTKPSTPPQERVRCPECNESFPNERARDAHADRAHFGSRSNQPDDDEEE